MEKIKLFILALCLSWGTMSFAQGKVEAELDSVAIQIGSQVALHVKASYPQGTNVIYHQLPDTLIKEIEVLETSVLDSSVVNGIIQLEQRYLLTSFDSGLHYIPPMTILEFEDGQKAQTPDLVLKVYNPFPWIMESEGEMIFDGTQVKDAPFNFSELMLYLRWILIGLLVVCIIVVAIWYYFRYIRKKDGEKPAKPVHVDPCDVIAIRELEQIKEAKLWQKSLFKEYYSGISDTLRKYVSERYGVNAMESTTDEIMDSLRDILCHNQSSADRLRRILEEADFVKFAKHEPLPDENDMAMKHALEFVENTRQQVADETNKGTQA